MAADAELGRSARRSGEPARGPPLGEPRHGPPPVAADAKLGRAGQLPSESHPCTRAVMMLPVGRAAGYGVDPSTPPRSSWKGGESPMYRATEALVHILPADARSSSFEGEEKNPSPTLAAGSSVWSSLRAVAPPPLCRRGALLVRNGDHLPLQLGPAWRGSILGTPLTCQRPRST